MIAASVWGFVALVAIAAAYDLALKAIKAWAPRPPVAQQTTGQMIDASIFAAQLSSMRSDMNALKIAQGFRAAREKTEAK